MVLRIIEFMSFWLLFKDASKAYLHCSNGYGTMIHAFCAGLSRSATLWQNNYGRNLRFVFDSCSIIFDEGKKLTKIERSVISQTDLLQRVLPDLKRLNCRMDITKEHINELDKSISQSSSSDVLKKLEDKLDRDTCSIWESGCHRTYSWWFQSRLSWNLRLLENVWMHCRIRSQWFWRATRSYRIPQPEQSLSLNQDVRLQKTHLWIHVT